VEKDAHYNYNDPRRKPKYINIFEYIIGQFMQQKYKFGEMQNLN
jgi:hypothetical protein